MEHLAAGSGGRAPSTPPHKTVRIALVVGTVLFAINQLDVVLLGRATPLVWFKIALTYLVPFCVSNLGILIASRRAHDRTEVSERGEEGA